MYIYGKNVALETIETKKKINRVFLMRNFKDQEVLNSLKKINVEIRYIDKKQMDKMVNGNHQGIILSVPDFKYNDIDELLEKENPLLVILDHIEDPHNLGAIIRTCEAAGVDGIIIPKDRSVSVNPTVIKVSTGAIDYMKIAQVTNLNNTIRYLKKQGFWIVGTDMDGESYSNIDYTGKCAIVIGNEGDGLSRMVRENCDFIASIPMNGKTNSLNASVAAGIIIYEAIKVRK